MVPASADAVEPLAKVPYAEEIRAKNEALARFWSEEKLPGRPGAILPSALPRGYRTCTKRRVVIYGKQALSLGFSDRTKPNTSAVSLLDPEVHNRIFAFLFDKLKTPAYAPLARALNWLILRDGNGAVCLILNVAKLDGTVVRKAKQLAEYLSASKIGVTSALMYVDPTRSEYYLTAERPQEGLKAKHLFGPRLLTLEVDGIRLKYPPTVFSQVNEAMVPVMVREGKRMLGITPQDRFLDLYCGYGLFSFTLGLGAKETLAVELEGDAVSAAKETARLRFPDARYRFIATRISKETVERLLPPATRDAPEVILLDPPRKGAPPEVIEALAKRRPRRVLQICCGTDEIAPAVRTWIESGYSIDEILPLDMFAGTPNLETLIALVPKKK